MSERTVITHADEATKGADHMTPEDHARRALDQDAAGRICLFSVATLASVIRAAALEEREAGAKKVESLAKHLLPCACDYCRQSMRDAASIRGRSAP